MPTTGGNVVTDELFRTNTWSKIRLSLMQKIEKLVTQQFNDAYTRLKSSDGKHETLR